MVRAIQIGLGNWGVSWAQDVIPTVEAIEMVAYVDPSPEARARLEQTSGIKPAPCFASLEEAAAACEADLVIATLRTEAHYPMVDKALDLGLNVIVEKPFAMTLAEAKAMVDKAEAKGLVLMVSQNYRHNPAPLKAAALVADRAMGDVTMVTVSFRKHAPSVGYRFWDMPDPLLADMSIHHFDLMRMVLGEEPVRVSCRSWNVADSRFVHHPVAIATIEFSEGTIVSYNGSWMSGAKDTSWSGEWSLDCADGEIAWSSRDQRPDGNRPDWLELRPLGAATRAVDLAPARHLDRAGALAAAAVAVETGRTPAWFTSGRDNLGSLALVRASILSAREEGRWVEIAEMMERGY